MAKRTHPLAVVKVRALSKVYGEWGSAAGGGAKALDKVTLGFAAGRVTAILGHNGAGKLDVA